MSRWLLAPGDAVSSPGFGDFARPGDVIIPLDLEATMLTRNGRWPVIGIEELVPYGEIRLMADAASEDARILASLTGGSGQWDGYDIPGLCRPAQDFLFRDIRLGQALADAIRRAGARDVLYLGEVAGPAYFAPTSGAVVKVLGIGLGDAFRVHRIPGTATDRFMVAARALRLGLGRLHAGLRRATISAGRARIVAAFVKDEWARFRQGLTSLSRRYGRDLQLWSLGLPTRALRSWSREQGIEVFWVPYPARPARGVAEFFIRGLERWDAGGREQFAGRAGLPLAADERLGPFFQFYFRRMWPLMAQWLADVENLLRRAAPECVLASSDDVPSYAIPHHAAAKLGIPSIALPHTASPQLSAPIRSSYLALRNAFERENHRAAFADDSRVLFCSDAMDDMSFDARPPRSSGPAADRLAVVFTAAEEFPGTLMAKVNRTVSIDVIERILHPPEGLDGIRWLVKSHPRSDLTRHMRRLAERDPRPGVFVSEPDASPYRLLSEAWVCVLCDHFGTVVIPAILSGKPVIFLDSAGFHWPGHNRFFMDAGEVASSPDELWAAVRRLMGDPATYAGLVSRARDFAGRWLKPPPVRLADRIAACVPSLNP